MVDNSQGRRALAGVRVVSLGAVLTTALLMMVGSASASTLCVQERANGKVIGPTTLHGSTCKAGYGKIELPEPAELCHAEQDSAQHQIRGNRRRR
jgi:hypothetical protein